MKVKVRSPIVLETEPKISPRVKDILQLLAAGSVLAAFIAFPTLPFVFSGLHKRRWEELDNGDWDKFNLWKLRSELKRLRKQKDVKIEIEAGLPVVRLTEKGKRKVLKYNLEDITLETKGRWDKKWRLIVYDVPEKSSFERNEFRRLLKRLNLYQLQKSVYLTPFPCEDEIQYVREFFNIGKEVQILTVTGLENEQVYRKYFGV